MHRRFPAMSHVLPFVIAAVFATAPAIADKPSWAGGGNKHESEGHQGRDRGDDAHRDADRHGGRHEHFGDRHRIIVREYYGEQFRSGHCPPGLAKKHNGCMPPGQAKKWRVGYALPREVAYYEVPPALVVELGRPPAGYRYVRVAADILLIAVGTGMVVDAIQDLGRM
jgi:Ni/Co efflux regulator RcnB